MKVTVFGAGYVGLVQAAVLAESGCEVVGIDVDAAKVAALTAGRIGIHEPDLPELILRNVSEGRLRFSTDASMGIAHGEIIFIAVGTPSNEDGSADRRHVAAVAETIGRHLTAPRIVVVKSTVPVGTSAMVSDIIAKAAIEAGHAADFDVVSNPEFLREGSAVADCMKPDRIILGTSSPRAEEALRDLYAPFNRNHEKIIVMDVASAELTKYAANAMLATRISFMNEIAVIADQLGADVEWVRKGIGADPRIGYAFIYSGMGYGGSCFPKDVRALINSAERSGIEPTVLRAVESRNESQKNVLFEKISTYFGGDITSRTFALWGLAFKPNTDDMREAPSRPLMEALWQAGARIRAYDPAAQGETARIYGHRDDLELVDSRDAALDGADALIIATEWKVFQTPDFTALKSHLRHPAIFDGRNLYDPARMQDLGFDYFAIGRGKRPQSKEIDT